MTTNLMIDRFILIVAASVSLLAVYTDLRWRIIPNRLTLSAIMMGFALNLAGNGWQGLLFAFIGCVVGFGLMLLPYLVGGMGAGDVKLMAALGALLGSYAVLNVFLFATVAGGIVAVIVAIRNRRLGRSLVNLVHIVTGLFYHRQMSTPQECVDKNIKVPYGVAIGTGMFCFLIFGSLV